MSAALRLLPSVDQVAAGLLHGAPDLPATTATMLAREAVAELRATIQAADPTGEPGPPTGKPGKSARKTAGKPPGAPLPADKPAALAAAVRIAERILESIRTAGPQPVINATGTILHTGLGRAPYSARAQEAVRAILDGYCTTEFDLETGQRGDRQDHVVPNLKRLTGAEAALVVNNCAGAAVLALMALAQGREVIVSRGELVEIGGAFRIPEIMTAAGCRLVEVGTTNKTRIADYRDAITPATALLLKVHKSNFVQEGFVAEVSTAELVALGHERGLPVLVDQGSGLLDDLSALGLDCPRMTDELAAGADLVCASGDKLLGGPQAGILLGTAELIERCAKHPMARALRCDKMQLAALAGTLKDYLLDDPRQAIPTLRMLHEPIESVRARAELLLTKLGADAGAGLAAVRSAVGSGALPTQGPASVAIADHGPSVAERAHRLRHGASSVVSRIAEDTVLLDLRTVSSVQIPSLATSLRNRSGT